ncbi:MAG: CehA/McbA family metallohydrolase [Alphaproteobacteria bacterium]|uniref:CehA/McbA family metallohydrolase n=1 Tax=Brevundimonas sp. TaxID=1871086 RepID=UPI001D23098B|nr:CehA/McbA family metallohydrolase [Alphaproteobacteria bacterium]MBU1520296.1 CehA/McbA family metallohydrolase [Alphaproteobacteria bacterium]MBU2030835.1 CehA/McbA family metallohydrolase [Alphaproteobacteria bacterium]MBU2163527.1 CehA/McbA family metallohydrolase [Alphaproteobacteria bacterium]MBU2231632.1 CehA/McbA family metallohydrolase [Alphaproteobacteria bacterium]
MRRLLQLAAILFLAATAPAALAGEPDPRPDLVLTGELRRADHERYREAAFDLPEGVTRLSVVFAYSGKEARSVIDLGLFDPQRFRGWSGGARDRFTISAEEATPGYLPGPLPAGRWRLILGAPNIRPGGAARYEAKVFFEREPRPADFAAGYPLPAPLNPAAGWYRGDLHTHTGHSDASCRTRSGARAPCPVYRTVEAAAARGLDFIAVTDHNTTAHYAALRELQPAFDDLLLVPGREITTFFGHANVFGPTDFLDFRMTDVGPPAPGNWLDAARAEGGLISINHPGLPSGEICMGCGWILNVQDPAAFDLVEVVNGGTLTQTGSAEGPLQGFDFWHARLNAGARIIGIGGSDNHDALRPLDQPGAIGDPTTVVHMRELSLAGLLDGLRAGRVFIDLEGRPDRLLDLSAQAGDRRAVMGQTLAVAPGERVQVTAIVRGVDGGRMEVVVDGVPSPALSRAIRGDNVDLTLDWAGGEVRRWLRADVRDASGRLVLVGNPVFLQRVVHTPPSQGSHFSSRFGTRSQSR